MGYQIGSFRPIVFEFGFTLPWSGGVSTVSKSDVNKKCIKRHGRWNTDLSKDGYIEDTFKKGISVSQKLGL